MVPRTVSLPLWPWGSTQGCRCSFYFFNFFAFFASIPAVLSFVPCCHRVCCMLVPTGTPVPSCFPTARSAQCLASKATEIPLEHLQEGSSSAISTGCSGHRAHPVPSVCLTGSVLLSLPCGTPVPAREGSGVPWAEQPSLPALPAVQHELGALCILSLELPAGACRFCPSWDTLRAPSLPCTRVCTHGVCALWCVCSHDLCSPMMCVHP